VVVTLSMQTLLIHLRMSGHLFVAERRMPVCKYTHGVFQLDNGTDLRFRDVRKFGTLHLLDTPHSVFAALGPEPLEKSFTAATLRAIASRRARQLKPLLLDQSALAGVGNIYADEALYLARIHPETISTTLSAKQITALHGAIRKVSVLLDVFEVIRLTHVLNRCYKLVLRVKVHQSIHIANPMAKRAICKTLSKSTVERDCLAVDARRKSSDWWSRNARRTSASNVKRKESCKY
jgi:hypothetical protein